MTNQVINIVTATNLGEYKIRLEFDDSTTQIVDFKSFLLRSHHPDIRAYIDPGRFASFRLDHGELIWGDYELCFPIIDLYANRIDVRSSMEAHA